MPLPQMLVVMSIAITSLGPPGGPVELLRGGVDPGPTRARNEFLVSTDELETRLGTHVVVEVGRDRRAFRSAHVKGARFLEWSTIARESKRGVSMPSRAHLESVLSELGVGNTQRVVIYSRNVLEATWAWFVFDSLGHGNRVAILDGGWGIWVKEGRPISGGEFVPGRVEFNATAVEEATIGLEELRERLSAPLDQRTFVIDSRAPDEYRGDVSGERVRRAGHIPGAFSISWTRNLEVVDGTALFRMPGALRELYLPGRPVGNGEAIVYCRTGLEASLSYFVLRTLGFRPRLYDGSYVEWSALPDVPVARTAEESRGPRN